MRLSGPWRVVSAVTFLLVFAGCGGADDEALPEPVTTTSEATPTSPATSPPVSPISPIQSPTLSRPPCDPGGGFPRPQAGRPDPEPETGWLTRGPDGRLLIEPFRTYGNDAEGEAYAEREGLEFPFANDYYDARIGPAQEFQLDPDTVCTGIILVRHQEPLGDHVVDCADLVDVAATLRVPVAVWRDGAHVVQVSELYRP